MSQEKLQTMIMQNFGDERSVLKKMHNITYFSNNHLCTCSYAKTIIFTSPIVKYLIGLT